MKPNLALGEGWWYPAVLAAILIFYIILMPKRMRWREIFLVFSVIGYIVWTIDMMLAAPFDIFDIAHPEKEGLPELLLYGILPACFSVIYLNHYKEGKKWLWASAFIIASFLAEWLAVQVGIMNLKHWNTWWSLPVYFVAYGFFLPWLLRIIRKD